MTKITDEQIIALNYMSYLLKNDPTGVLPKVLNGSSKVATLAEIGLNPEKLTTEECTLISEFTNALKVYLGRESK